MVLTASEAAIYERFGYGAAVFASRWTLRTDALELARPSTAGGRMRMVDFDEARKLVPGIFDRARSRHVGAVTRSDARWDVLFADRKEDRQRRSWFTVVHESATGRARRLRVLQGRAARARRWAAERDRGHGSRRARRRSRSRAVGLPDPRRSRGVDPHREPAGRRAVALATRRPAACPRRRACTTTCGCAIVDPEVGARRTSLRDRRRARARARPIRSVRTNDGCWLVDGGTDGAEVSRTDRAPDLALTAPELGSIFLGGVSPSALAARGGSARSPRERCARADALFSSSPAPWCATHF